MSVIEIETTIKSGLPVLAMMDYEQADPTVGIYSDSVSEPVICWLSGKQVTSKVYDSIPKSDFIRIMEEALETKHTVEVY